MNNGRSAKQRILAVLVFGAVLALLVRLTWLFTRAPDRTEAARLIELKTVAIAHLENEQLNEADGRFSDLLERLPREPLAARNLVIARLLAAKQAALESKGESVQRAEKALQTLFKIDIDSAVTHLLAAWLAVESGDIKLATERFQRAGEIDPNDPAIWFTWNLAVRAEHDRAMQHTGDVALGHARRARPNNLFLLTQWLETLAQRKDPTIIEPLEQARTLVQPIAESVRERMGGRVDLVALVEESLAAARAEDWAQVVHRTLLIGNAIRPTDRAQSDRRELDPHPLQYVLHEFTAETMKALGSPDISVAPADPAALATIRLLPLSEPDQLAPEIDDVRELRLEDIDLDSKADIVVLRARELEVYSRARFKPSNSERPPWRLAASAPVPQGMNHFVLFDLDNQPEPRRRDAKPAAPRASVPAGQAATSSSVCPETHLDLLVYGPAGLRLFAAAADKGSSALSFVDATEQSGLAGLTDVLVATPSDLDHDGDLDLIVSTATGMSLWSNRGNRTFKDISRFSELPPRDVRVTSLATVDWDHDVDIDIVTAGESSDSVGFLENLRHGEFRWRALVSRSDQAMTFAEVHQTAVLDVDGNVSWDLLLAGDRGVSLLRTRTPVPGTVQFVGSSDLLNVGAMGMVTADFDNDGRVDVFVWGDDETHGFHGEPSANFTKAPELVARSLGNVRAADFDDLDSDGDLDLAVVSAGRVVLLENQGGNSNGWLSIQLRAEQSRGGGEVSSGGRVNPRGVGSLLEIRGRTYQARVVARTKTHFGLGPLELADNLRVLWTDGIPNNLIGPTRNQTICEVWRLKGSCPYLYVWNGSRYEFFTDLLWSAPLGLQHAEGVFAVPRAWEYLAVPGDRLRPRDGCLDMEITEELWEAAYLDQVELIAVDHPEDVEIVSNEKVGPPSLAEFKIHTLREPRAPVAALDPGGRDLLDALRHRDSRFAQTFSHRVRQGLTDEHFLELDLGELDRPRNVTLFLTGWVYPTDTSINVALSQDPTLPSPNPPALWVVDQQGDWNQAIPFMGFPGGKTKTIAVDLSGVFEHDDYRLRIVSNMELYWDWVAFTVDESPAELQVQPLELESAELRYRGFSAWSGGHNLGPEDYDHDSVTTEPTWPPMAGRFTRYGDVTEILRESDDCVAIMGAGDAIRLRFLQPAAPPPAGWKRDFILHSTGWDKDADLNTAFGQTVEPLPFRAMTGYPYGPGESYPDTPRHRRYLAEYQTRTQSPARFWHPAPRAKRRGTNGSSRIGE